MGGEEEEEEEWWCWRWCWGWKKVTTPTFFLSGAWVLVWQIADADAASAPCFGGVAAAPLGTGAGGGLAGDEP